MESTQTNTHPRALLFSVRTPKMTDAEATESMTELERLVTTLGYEVAGTMSQRQPSTKGIAVVGEGKLMEIAQLTAGKGSRDRVQGDPDAPQTPRSGISPLSGTQQAPVPAVTPEGPATVVIFDCELSPSQIRNVETAVGVPVLDRTGVIIEIFNRHAKTRAARLQVDIARQTYQAPRLRDTGVGKGHQSGKGTGETVIETEKRKVRDRLAELRQELEAVQREEEHRRMKRAELLGVALVGYTNAGKSSLMRALTGSEVLVEDKLFATLDTTVRALQPETQPRILITDTVGFIHKLPHDLVASFRSTLEEARGASLLLYVVDAADRNFRSQLAVVREVLGDIGADTIPHLLILNKADRLSEWQKQVLGAEYPNAVLTSTRSPEDMRVVSERIVQFFEKDMIEKEILVPYKAQGVMSEMRPNMKILKESFTEEGVRLLVRARPIDLQRLGKMMK
ncbi:MAG TPA: GTPase HflX [bacterium]|nr:GTPase HflX [bacterium]